MAPGAKSVRDEARPSRYVYDVERGVWRHPAKPRRPSPSTGFHITSFTPSRPALVWLRNVRFLQDFVSIDPPVGVDRALEALGEAQSLSLSEAFTVAGTTRETWYLVDRVGPCRLRS